MKKVFIFVMTLLLILLSSCSPKKENLTGDVTVPRPLNEKTFQDSLKLAKLDSTMEINTENIQSLGFNRCIIKSQGLRTYNGKFKTDFARKKTLIKQTNLLSEADISYYIEITTGPGVSPNRDNLSLYTNKDNIVFFAQMVKETIEMNKESPYFNGIILNIGSPKINTDIYYETLKEISDRVLKTYDIPLILTLDSHYLQGENQSLPLEYFENPNIGFNIDMDFKYEEYPGPSNFNGSEVNLNKNYILEKLLSIKNSDTSKPSRKVIISLKCPWSKGSSVLVKDVFEIMKMIGFEFSFSYSNTNDEYDFSKDKGITNILRKY